jgi:integrase
MPRLHETRALRVNLPSSGQKLIWCSEVHGFGCRILPSGVRSWVVQVRYGGRSHRITLGPVGTLPFEGPPHAPGARDLAVAAINAARRGENPKLAIGHAKKPGGATLADLWKAYEAAGFPLPNGKIGHKRQSSIKADRYRWGKHFRSIEHEPAKVFDTPRTQRWMDSIEGLGARSHALMLLKALLAFGASRGLCERHQIDIAARRSRKVQNFLKPTELKHLDAVLAKKAAEQPERVIPFSALRLLIHTGMRKGEVLSLDWSSVDLDHRVIHLERDKASGENAGRDVLLTDAAVDVLRSLPRLAKGGHVFFGRRRNAPLVDLEFAWGQARQRAKLKHIRIHDLRHSFASAAIGNGVSLHVVGQLLGHRDAKTSARYAHLTREAARQALDKVSEVLS